MSKSDDAKRKKGDDVYLLVTSERHEFKKRDKTQEVKKAKFANCE